MSVIPCKLIDLVLNTHHTLKSLCQLSLTVATFNVAGF